MRKSGQSRRFWSAVAVTAAAALALAGSPALATTSQPARDAAGAYSPPPTYQAHDYAHGQAMDILPAGENGLVNLVQLRRFERTGKRPANSQDELAPYASLVFGAKSLTDATLSRYYLDESFGIPRGQVAATEHPSASVPVVIYRDRHDIPHVYGATDPAMAFGAG